MTYPLEASNLVAYLRAFSVATADPESNDAATIIKPLQFGLNRDELNKFYLSNLRPESPPIPYDLRSQASTVPAAPSDSKRSTKSHAKKRSSVTGINNVKKETRKSVLGQKDTEAADVSDGSVKTIGLSELNSPQDTLPLPHLSSPDDTRKPRKKKNPLVKLFQKSDKSSISSGPENSIDYSIDKSSIGKTSNGRSSLDTAHDHEARIYESEPEMRTFTIDSGSSLERHALRQHSTADTIQDSVLELPNDNVTSISGSYLQGSGGSSTDSAFTDIEGDSLMDVGSDLMYDYSVPESYVLQEAKNLKKQKRKMKKNHSSASLFSSVQRSSLDENGDSKNDRPRARRQADSLKFEKMYFAVGDKNQEPAPSNLSRMILSKFRSTFVNPLNYFGFVGSDAPMPNSHKVFIDFFTPPKDKPTLEKLPIWNSTPVHECIGYVLLQLSNMSEYKDNLDKEFINPNNWRIELIDEDGELYDGNFGVLDRTRQLSSYNSPNCLALCRVTKPGEIKNNERQTPLPPDFKQNLDTFDKHPGSGHTSEPMTPQFDTQPDQMGVDTIEVKVDNIPDSHTNIVSFFISSHMTVGQLLDLICLQYQIDPLRYRLAQADFPDKQTNMLGDDIQLSKNSWQQPLDNAVLLSTLPTNKFKFVPNLSQTIRPLTDVRMDSFRDNNITPSSATYIPHGITPPTSQLEGKAEDVSASMTDEKDRMAPDFVHDHEPKKASKADPDMSAIANRVNKLTFGDILNQNRPSLPVSLNTIYFKWTVYRKKPPIINRIEKALIIDGDYIHLAPTDDVNWRNNPADNPLSTSNNLSHHHYLHHYNYSKFYKETMMKTSSFHITQIVKLKQYTQSKNPNHFKIVIQKPASETNKDSAVKKKYDLEAENATQCQEIVEKIRWTLQVYNNMIEK